MPGPDVSLRASGASMHWRPHPAARHRRDPPIGTNVGTPDRIVRIVVAILAVVGALNTAGILSVVLWIVAAIMAITAVVGFCPLYRLVGVNTCKGKN